MLEAVASQDLWIWHAFFGVAGANNDINVLNNSPLFNDLLDDKALVASYVVNGVEFEKGYYLADGSKNKLGFLDDTCKRPADTEPSAKQWYMCNSVVLTWILNSISAKLFVGQVCQVFSKTASLIWVDLQETYNKVDVSVTFNLHKSINSLSQNGMPLSDYYHKLNSLWRQFDALTSLPACSCTEESHIGVSSNSTPSKPHATAFVSKGYDNKRTGRERPSTSSPVSLTNEQMLRLMNLINDKLDSPISANMADSGANQHMTISDKLLHNIVDIAHLGLTVGHLNGTHALIKKIGDLKLTKDITLYDFLVVPKYNVSLLSVHKLTRDNKLYIGFDEHKCYIQDLKKKELVEIGNESGGLYLFNVDNTLNCKTSYKSLGCLLASSFLPPWKRIM
ncbi:ribonuclease H-like domain-containing protein [Tanacetum coccineum]|uniref:Ribonuclease H-like domain-containing protein n=1 Tax=Tanacetum coccineum TaxID=301880 RepID=A0ABQ4Y8V3_9ASTR